MKSSVLKRPLAATCACGEAHGFVGELKGLNIRLEGHGDSLFAEQSYTVEYLDPKAKK